MPESAWVRSLIPHRDPTEDWMQVRFAPGGRRLAAITRTGCLQVLDTGSGSQIWRHEEHEEVTCGAFGADPAVLWFACGAATLRCRDLDRGITTEYPPMPPQKIACLAVAPDGGSLVFGAGDGRVFFWAGPGLTEPRVLGRLDVRQFEGWSPRVRFADDGTRILAWSLHEVKVWDPGSGAGPATIRSKDLYADRCDDVWDRAPSNHIMCADLSTDGRWVITGTRQRKVELWDAEDGKLVRSFFAPDENLTFMPLESVGEGIQDVAFLPSGLGFVTASQGIVRQWDMATGAVRGTMNGRCDLRELVSPVSRRVAVDDGVGLTVYSKGPLTPVARYAASFAPVGDGAGGRVWASERGLAHLVRLEGVEE